MGSFEQFLNDINPKESAGEGEKKNMAMIPNINADNLGRTDFGADDMGDVSTGNLTGGRMVFVDSSGAYVLAGVVLLAVWMMRKKGGR